MNQISENETQSTRAKYNRNARFYNFMEFPIEILWYRRWRRRMFSKVPNDKSILEVGVGTGKNLPFYPDMVRAFGIDLSEGMFSKASKQARRRALRFAQADAQNLPFRDNSFDVVVATFVFCSVPDPIAGLQEVSRVLKADGELLLLEHVLPENSTLARLFNWLNPWMVRRGGVHINRKTSENVQRASFKLVEQKNLLATIFKFLRARPKLNGRY